MSTNRSDGVGLMVALVARSNEENGDRELLQRFHLSLRVKNVRPDTYRCYAERLDWFLRFLGPQGICLNAVSRQDIEAYILQDIDRLSPESINGRIRILRAFYRWRSLDQPGQYPNSPMKGIGLLRYDRKMKPVLDAKTVGKLLSETTLRNQAMILLMYDGMLRSKEVRGLAISDVDLVQHTVAVRQAKSRFARIVPVGPETCKALRLWLKKRPAEGYLFPGHKERMLGDTSLKTMMVRLSRRTGIYVHPHLLRHSGATAWLRAGGDSKMIQRAMGLRTPLILDNYLHLGADALVEAKARTPLLEGVKVKIAGGRP